MRKAFLALLLAASVTPALAQDKTVNMKVSLWVPPAHPLVPATKAWADWEAGWRDLFLASFPASVEAIDAAVGWTGDTTDATAGPGDDADAETGAEGAD